MLLLLLMLLLMSLLLLLLLLLLSLLLLLLLLLLFFRFVLPLLLHGLLLLFVCAARVEGAGDLRRDRCRVRWRRRVSAQRAAIVRGRRVRHFGAALYPAGAAATGPLVVRRQAAGAVDCRVLEPSGTCAVVRQRLV